LTVTVDQIGQAVHVIERRAAEHQRIGRVGNLELHQGFTVRFAFGHQCLYVFDVSEIRHFGGLMVGESTKTTKSLLHGIYVYIIKQKHALTADPWLLM